MKYPGVKIIAVMHGEMEQLVNAMKLIADEWNEHHDLRYQLFGSAHVFYRVTDGYDPFECWCHRCDGFRRELVGTSLNQNAFLVMPHLMIVCPDCGNKRCPKATWHELECTGSNETGQKGSIYGTP